MHIALANFYLLSITGPEMPAELSMESEKKVTSKAEVIGWLTRSLEAVKTAHAAATPEDLKRGVKIYGRDASVDGMYLRIIIHANEHMGQLIAYARMNGIVPPWSKESPPSGAALRLPLQPHAVDQPNAGPRATLPAREVRG